MQTVVVERKAPLLRVTITRPDVRNAVDGPTALALADAFRSFERDAELSVAILCGAGGNFCAGADLKALASGDVSRMNKVTPPSGDALDLGPMGPTRFRLSKPVIAEVSGYCVAGGLELALWCDLRIADETATFGVYCRRFGVPLIDGGTIRLPRAIGMSRALDMILTGRAVRAAEALEMGLANRVVTASELQAESEKLALQIAAFPQRCMREDRLSAYEQWSLPEGEALMNEAKHGLATFESGEIASGAASFSAGRGRHGNFG